MWKLYDAASRKCPQRRLLSGVSVLSHDDWQGKQMAAHHWAVSCSCLSRRA